MKATAVFSLLLPLCAAICGCPEDDYIESKNYGVDLQGAVFVEGDQTEFAQGDTLWVVAEVPDKIEAVRGPIDIYGLNGATSAMAVFHIEKKDDFEIPFLLRFTDKDLVPDKGNVTVDEYDSSKIRMELQRNSDGYSAKFGLILKANGTFLFSHINSAYNEPKNQFTIWFEDPVYEEPYEHVQVNTTIRQSNVEGKYVFRVLPD